MQPVQPREARRMRGGEGRGARFEGLVGCDWVGVLLEVRIEFHIIYIMRIEGEFPQGVVCVVVDGCSRPGASEAAYSGDSARLWWR